MPVVRVAAVQPNSRESTDAVVKSALRLTDRAGLKGASIACLPEHWLLGHQVDMNSTIDSFRKIAKKHGMYVIPGANYAEYPSAKRIESVLIDPNGEIIGRQWKTHLFRSEKDVAKPGDEYQVYDIGDCRIGIAICHDAVFPEVSRILVIQGADILFVPSRIVAEGLSPWIIYLRARALENRVAVVSPNALAPPRFPGGSVLIGLEVSGEERIVHPRVIARAYGRPAVLVADIEVNNMRIARAERMASRRPEIYKDLCLPPRYSVESSLHSGKLNN